MERCEREAERDAAEEGEVDGDDDERGSVCVLLLVLCASVVCLGGEDDDNAESISFVPTYSAGLARLSGERSGGAARIDPQRVTGVGPVWLFGGMDEEEEEEDDDDDDSFAGMHIDEDLNTSAIR